MRALLHKFAMHELHAVLDAVRRARGLSWPALVAEINKPFEGTPSIPISVSTVRGMQKKTNLGERPLIGFPRVMMITQWLEPPAASFVRDHDR